MAHPDLTARFLEQLETLRLDGRDEGPVLVALSGGCDSVALLHLLRFAGAPRGLRIVAAHLDHAMRPDSAADARWVRGLCRAWRVPLRSARLRRAPRSEADARRARYRYLRSLARRLGARWILTAHHADDQAETVLFRALRGTGLRGLAGIAARVEPRADGGAGLLRPLLPFWRDELEAYARQAGLRWRADPSNRELGPARNRIRHQLLPLAERHVAPGARRSLVRLAREAREAEAALEARARLAADALLRAQGDAWLLARDRLRDYDAAVAARLIRRLLRRFGLVLDRAGTRAALQFITDAPSGRQLQLPQGVRIDLEFEVARIRREAADAARPAERTLRIVRDATTGEGVLCVGAEPYTARWWTGPADADAPRGPLAAALDPAAAAFPLLLRGWRPGDRVRTPGGTKTLKKLFVEKRVPRSQRARLPVLEDAAGRLLWVAGLDLVTAPPRPQQTALFLRLDHGGPRPDSDPDRGA